MKYRIRICRVSSRIFIIIDVCIEYGIATEGESNKFIMELIKSYIFRTKIDNRTFFVHTHSLLGIESQRKQFIQIYISQTAIQIIKRHLVYVRMRNEHDQSDDLS